MRISLPDLELVEALEDLASSHELLHWPLEGPAPVEEIDLVVAAYLRLVPSLGSLGQVRTRLVQGQSIGYDGVAAALGPGRVYANAAGVHEASTAEWAVALALASLRGLPGFVRAQQEGRWAQAFRPALADKRVLLVGFGGVGRAIATRLAPFEVQVRAVARRARVEGDVTVLGPETLAEELGRCNVAIVAVPLDPSTRGLVDDHFLASLPDGALLVNVSRGPVADTEALVRVARAGRLHLALDVVDPEPLPTAHPLWGLENVLLTPHVGGATSAMLPRMAKLIREQVARLDRGDAPLNVVVRT